MEKGDPSGSVIKKKNSSGCLIIKKKGDGVGGFGASGAKKAFDSRKEKKRPRLVLSDSGSSDELLEPLRRKITDRYRNGSVSYKKGHVEDRIAGRNFEIDTDRKRSGLDVFEFDEYDGFDGKKMRKDYMDHGLKLAGRSGNHKESAIGSSRNVAVDRRKDTYFDGKGSISSGKSKGFNYTGKDRYEMAEDESHLPISFLREKHRAAPNEPIRLQGKNGVLKVMVNKKKKHGLADKNYDHQGAEDRKGSRSEAAGKKKEVIQASFYSDSKRPEKTFPFVRSQKSETKLRRSLPIKSSKAEDSETDDSDASLKQELTSIPARSSTKASKYEDKGNSPTGILTPLRGKKDKEGKEVKEDKEGKEVNEVKEGKEVKEVKSKRGSGTEKQLLREKIRSMLLNCGWTIDYRPRRNRDYLDAVYINPTGTAYWSIIKAYDALQKQLEEEDDNTKPSGDSSPFTPLPEEILSKLTRQTRKKIEREMKKKKRDAGCSRSSKKNSMKESAEGTDTDQNEDKLSFFMKQNHKSLKGRSREAGNVSGDDSSDNLHKGTPKEERVEKPLNSTNSHIIQGRKSRKIGRCTLLVRCSDKGLNSDPDGFVPYTGKRTLLSWLIDSGIVHMSEKVQYMNRRKTKVMLEGWITRDGIHCGCCSKILTISKFEIHAGSKQRQSFPNIYLESGLSLMQCQIEAWNRQEESERKGFYNVDVGGDDPNDDTCGLCGDGGDLICCDGCPSTFHQSCLGIQMLPEGDWHCPNCTCKFCGFAGCSNTEVDNRTDSGLLLCDLCEKKYHQSCSQEVDDDLPVDLRDVTNSFCGKKCREVFGHLQKFVGVKHELESGFSWCLVHRMDPTLETLQNGLSQRVECNSKLAVALSVMDECFLPIVDRRSGINLIHNVLYNCGSNFSRLNYSGFYTAILERGDEIISAASIRIHGTQLAEMPFIGTRDIYRRQGMCRRLLCAIESTLCFLKVEKLIIPAIAEHMQTWTESFNFKLLEESHKKVMRSMNMLVFPGTDMLQKLLMKPEIQGGSKTVNSDTKPIEAKDNHLILPVLEEKPEQGSSPQNDVSGMQPLNENRDKATATCSDSQGPTVLSKDIHVTCNLNASSEPHDKHQPANEEALSINLKSANVQEKSTANLKSTSSSDPSPDIREVGNSLLDPPVQDLTRSSANDIMGHDLEENVKASCVGLILDSVIDPSAMNMADMANGIPNSVSVPTIHDTYESKHVDSDLNHESSVDLGDSREANANGPVVFAAEQISVINSSEEIAPVETSIQSSQGDVGDAHEVNEEFHFVAPVIRSSDETSAHNNIFQVTGGNLTESSCGTDGMGDDVNEDKMKYSGGDEQGNNTHEEDAKVACVEPVLDSSCEVLARNNSPPALHENLREPNSGSDESTIQLKSVSGDQSAIGTESENQAAKEVASGAM